MVFGKKKENLAEKPSVEKIFGERVVGLEKSVADLAGVMKQFISNRSMVDDNNGSVIDTSNSVLFENKSIVTIPSQKFSLKSDDTLAFLKKLKGLGIVCSISIPQVDDQAPKTVVEVVEKDSVVEGSESVE